MATATVATALVHNLDEGDYAFLDPIMGTCWTSVAEAFVREMVMLRSEAAAAAAATGVTGAGTSTSGVEQQLTALNRQLDIVVYAMNRLGGTVPLAGV